MYYLCMGNALVVKLIEDMKKRIKEINLGKHKTMAQLNLGV